MLKRKGGRKKEEKKRKKKRDRQRQREREFYESRPAFDGLLGGEGAVGGGGGEEGCSKTLQSIIYCEFQRQLKKLFSGVGAVPAVTSLMC